MPLQSYYFGGGVDPTALHPSDIGAEVQGWSSLLDSIVAGGFILKDQYNEQAISTLSDTWNTDSQTTLIVDPDYGYVVVNGSLLIRSGGNTVSQLNNDGSMSASSGLFSFDAGGNINANSLNVADNVLALSMNAGSYTASSGAGYYGIVSGAVTSYWGSWEGLYSADGSLGISALAYGSTARMANFQGTGSEVFCNSNSAGLVANNGAVVLELYDDGTLHLGGTIIADTGQNLYQQGNPLSGLFDGTGYLNVGQVNVGSYIITNSGIELPGGTIVGVYGANNVPTSDGSTSGVAAFQGDGSLAQATAADINALVPSTGGAFTGIGAATTGFAVVFDTVQPDTNYTVSVTPRNTLSTALFNVSAKSTTGFTVTYLTGLTGSVAFDWALTRW